MNESEATVAAVASPKKPRARKAKAAKVSDEQTARTRLHAFELDALQAIGAAEEMTPGELAEAMTIKESEAERACESMARRGVLRVSRESVATASFPRAVWYVVAGDEEARLLTVLGKGHEATASWLAEEAVVETEHAQAILQHLWEDDRLTSDCSVEGEPMYALKAAKGETQAPKAEAQEPAPKAKRARKAKAPKAAPGATVGSVFMAIQALEQRGLPEVHLADLVREIEGAKEADVERACAALVEAGDIWPMPNVGRCWFIPSAVTRLAVQIAEVVDESPDGLGYTRDELVAITREQLIYPVSGTLEAWVDDAIAAALQAGRLEECCDHYVPGQTSPVRQTPPATPVVVEPVAEQPGPDGSVVDAQVEAKPATAPVEGPDFYATPAWVTEAILPHLPLGAARILEPSAGEGAIVRALLAAGVPGDRLLAVEIDARRARLVPCQVVEADFLTAQPWDASHRPGLVIGNPPFSLAQEFVEHALEVVAPGGTVAMLLRLAFLESAKRLDLHRSKPADLYVLPSRPSFTSNGKTDSAAYAWFVWGPGRGGHWQILDCAKPGSRAAKGAK